MLIKNKEFEKNLQDFFGEFVPSVPDDEDLIHALSTYIYDSYDGEYEYRKGEGGRPTQDFETISNKEYMSKMKKLFPDHWEDAIDGFLNGQHDT